jgi:hypothetical protein
VKLWPALLGATFAMSVAALGRAQGVDEFGAYGRPKGRERAESPQKVAVEIRIGRYVPNIDGEFDGQTPYLNTFGPDNRYSFGLEVDWQAMRIPFVGTLGPGFGFAYTRMSAQGFVTSTLGTPNPIRAGEETSLRIFPGYVVAVLRADYFARNTPVPLVPYAKLGLGAGIWTISNGGGTASVPGAVGSGISYGPQFALGGMFLLDALEPTAAVAMDEDTGVNNSYFFVEWYVSALGLGSNQMHVGTNTWVLGLALEI